METVRTPTDLELARAIGGIAAFHAFSGSAPATLYRHLSGIELGHGYRLGISLVYVDGLEYWTQMPLYWFAATESEFDDEEFAPTEVRINPDELGDAHLAIVNAQRRALN